MQNEQTVVIENTQQRPIGHPEFPGSDKADPHPGFFLSPGENDVDANAWLSFLDTKIGAQLRDLGHVREVKGKKKATPLVHRLSLVEESKAIALVEGCTSAHLLRVWEKDDSRNRVRRAITRRLDRLAVPTSEPEAEADSAKGKPASKG